MEKLVETLKDKGIKAIIEFNVKDQKYESILIYTRDLKIKIVEKSSSQKQDRYIGIIKFWEEAEDSIFINTEITYSKKAEINIGHGITHDLFIKGEIEEVLTNCPNAPF